MEDKQSVEKRGEGLDDQSKESDHPFLSIVNNLP
jgi:hypothetical protein